MTEAIAAVLEVPEMARVVQVSTRVKRVWVREPDTYKREPYKKPRPWKPMQQDEWWRADAPANGGCGGWYDDPDASEAAFQEWQQGERQRQAEERARGQIRQQAREDARQMRESSLLRGQTCYCPHCGSCTEVIFNTKHDGFQGICNVCGLRGPTMRDRIRASDAFNELFEE